MNSVAVFSAVQLTMSSALPEADTADRVQLLPLYKLLLLNDDYHSMDFVVETLTKVMRWALAKAMEVMLLAHHEGKAVVMIGPLEVVELKFEQLTSLREGEKGPLRCVIEPC